MTYEEWLAFYNRYLQENPPYNSSYSGTQIDSGIDKALNPDSTPTNLSDNLITSDGVKSALKYPEPYTIVHRSTVGWIKFLEYGLSAGVPRNLRIQIMRSGAGIFLGTLDICTRINSSGGYFGRFYWESIIDLAYCNHVAFYYDHTEQKVYGYIYQNNDGETLKFYLEGQISGYENANDWITDAIWKNEEVSSLPADAKYPIYPIENHIGRASGIIAIGNTHDAITSGQYVYVYGHETLAFGLYKSMDNISENGTLSTSNLTAISSGGLNDLQENTVWYDTFPLTKNVTATYTFNRNDAFILLISRSNTNDANTNGLYIGMAYNGASTIRAIAAADNATVSISGLTLSITVAGSSYRARLIRFAR